MSKSKVKNLLFVFEGQKSEPKAFESLQRYFINEEENTVVHAVFCGEIYSLYHTLKKDEDLELFYLLRQKDVNKEALSNLHLKDISEIYLFFDHDGHATAADKNKLTEMLTFFDEETDHGKLYISYPMVEAIRHYHPELCFMSLTALISNNKIYKGHVAHSCCPTYQNIAVYSKEQWTILIENNIKKANYIVENVYTVPSRIFTQIEIFESQLARFINPSSMVSVVSSIPLFLLDYYGVTNLLEKIGD